MKATTNKTSDLAAFLPELKALQEQVAQANRAVVSLVQSVADLDDPVIASLFGISQSALSDLRNARTSSFTEAIQSGIPLFTLRITDPSVLSALRHNFGAEEVFRAIMSTIPTPEIPRGAR
jgi:hypothetical protein